MNDSSKHTFFVPTRIKRQLACVTVGCTCWVLGGQPNFDPDSLRFDS